MKKSKRTIAWSLAMLMLATTLTGCGAVGKDTREITTNDGTSSGGRNDLGRDTSNADGADAGNGNAADRNAGSGAVQNDIIQGVPADEGYFSWEAAEAESDMSYDSFYGYNNSYSTAEAPMADAWGWDYGYGGEEYAAFEDSGFWDTREQPISTFSADVDTASYSNIRRMIEDGYWPELIPQDSVRIEEMVNYFSYDYEGPRTGEPFGINAEMTRCPWNSDRNSFLMMVGLQTERVDFSEAPPCNLVFLLDVSGSMDSEDKLPLLKQAFTMLAANLTARDRVSIVTYAGEDRVVLSGARGSDTDEIISALNSLRASGSTNGSAGIMTAYRLASEYFIEGGNNRVILATDGDLNVGLTSLEDLEALITRERESGVYLSVLGFGMGNIKDNRMELLADKGNGNYAYIDSLNEARKVLVEEMCATIITVAEDVKLQMEFNPDVVAEYRLIGYENRALATEDFTDDTKDAGEVGAGHSVTVLYEIRLIDKRTTELPGEEWCTLHVRYKEPGASESRQLDYPLGSRMVHVRPSEDIVFAGCVAQVGMLLRNSPYSGSASYEGVLTSLNDLHLRGDIYKSEFVDLVEQLIENNSMGIYY